MPIATGTAIAIAGATAAVGGTAYSISQQKKASRAQQRQQRLQARQSRRRAFRESQIRRSAALATAEAAGGFGGSGVSGGIGSLSSQLGSQLGYASQLSGINRQVAQYQTGAATGQGIASLGQLAFNLSGGFGGPADSDSFIDPIQQA